MITDETPGPPDGRGEIGLVLGSTIFREDLASRAKLVYACLTVFADGDGVCTPSHGQIERAASLSKKTVIEALRDLAEAGVISIEMRQGESNYYELHDASPRSHPKAQLRLVT